jgi:phospholipid/cholesterol/gamma-HCH transport system substrate-binding protein
MPATHNEFTTTEIKAGALVLASLVILSGFIVAIRGCSLGRSDVNTYSAEFTNISGLDVGADVRFGGVAVGRVVDISPDPEDRSKIRVVAEVPARVPVNHGSVATIEQVTLTTGKHLEISTGDKDQPLHASGDSLESVTSPGGFIDIPDLEGVISRLETMLDGVITLLGVDRAQALAAENGVAMVNLADVAAALEHTLSAGGDTVERVGETIAENREGLRKVVERLTDLEAAATELVANLNAAVDENREPLHTTMVNFQGLSADAGRQLEELTESLSVTLRYLEDLSGNASDLVEEQRPTLEQILVNLESTTRHLKRFSETLAEQPNALVRGSKPQGRATGDKP